MKGERSTLSLDNSIPLHPLDLLIPVTQLAKHLIGMFTQIWWRSVYLESPQLEDAQ